MYYAIRRATEIINPRVGSVAFGTKLQWCLALMSRRIREAATEGFPHLGNFFAATLFRYPTNVEVVLGIVETEENG